MQVLSVYYTVSLRLMRIIARKELMMFLPLFPWQDWRLRSLRLCHHAETDYHGIRVQLSLKSEQFPKPFITKQHIKLHRDSNKSNGCTAHGRTFCGTEHLHMKSLMDGLQCLRYFGAGCPPTCSANQNNLSSSDHCECYVDKSCLNGDFNQRLRPLCTAVPPPWLHALPLPLHGPRGLYRHG